jgi:2-keto-3-deoxy-L-rhamnonate aldolase RhmA
MTLAGNRALDRLRGGKAIRALWLSLGSPALAEIAAEQAPDAIVFDLQHGLWDVASLHSGIAFAARTSTPLVRVAANRADAIGQALDAGAAGVIVPLVESAGEAAAAVAAAHYPPRGIRSGGAMRPLADFPAYLAATREKLLVSVMIETRAGLDHAAAIAAVPGVDLIFIGTGDLGLALAGEPADALETAVGTIRAVAEAAGTPCGVFTGTAEAARDRIAQGFHFVVADDDIRLARGGFQRSLALVSA